MNGYVQWLLEQMDLELPSHHLWEIFISNRFLLFWWVFCFSYFHKYLDYFYPYLGFLFSIYFRLEIEYSYELNIYLHMTI